MNDVSRREEMYAATRDISKMPCLNTDEFCFHRLRIARKMRLGEKRSRYKEDWGRNKGSLGGFR
jgi:hypothetical protein